MTNAERAVDILFRLAIAQANLTDVAHKTQPDDIMASLRSSLHYVEQAHEDLKKWMDEL